VRPRSLLVDVDLIDAYLRQRRWTWQQIERGDVRGPGGDAVTMDEIQAFLINTDPVIWGERNLINKPENGGGLWRFFAYQKPSLRLRADVVHEDGAGVGKTREIVCLLLWGSTTRAGGSLVGGADDGNLEEMWDEIQWQLESNPWLADQVSLERTKVKPYRKLAFRNGNIVRFRPAGHDGRAFRAVHVHGFGMFDEAAKPDNAEVFSEFFRACEPGCETRLYSVPDGRRSSRYYQLCEGAVKWKGKSSVHPLLAAPSIDPSSPAAASAGALQERRFIKFNWQKTSMPPPYWDDVREMEAVRRYGGRDTSGYVRNVLGGWGDPEDPVFPWATFSPCLQLVKDYVVLKLLNDPSTTTIYAEAHKPTEGYIVRRGSDVESGDEEDAGGTAPLTEVYRNQFEPGNFDVTQLLRRVFDGAHARPGIHRVAGCDVGGTADEPTELGVSEQSGRVSRWVARVQLKRFDYDSQARIVCALDRIFEPDFGWGLDATGVGRALEDPLRGRAGAGHNFADRLTGFVFNAKTDLRNLESGDVVEDEAKNPKRVTYKELGTLLLEFAFQRGRVATPWDPDYVRDFSSHRARILPSGERAYSRERDHVIDEKRVEALRSYQLEWGSLGSSHIGHAVAVHRDRGLDGF
jgi:hypothetical protein